MILRSDDWVFVSGQADTGKTTFIKEHIKKMPMPRLFIYDFNGNDYQEFNTPGYWLVESGDQEEIEAFLKEVYAKGNSFTVLDEADNYFGYPSAFLSRFVNTARNRGIGAFVNAKRSKAIKPVFRNRFTKLVIFRTSIPEDIIYLEKWAGVEKGRFESLRYLQQGEHIIVNLINGNVSEVERLTL